MSSIEIGDAEVRAFALTAASAEVDRIFTLFPELRAQFVANGKSHRAAAPAAPSTTVAVATVPDVNVTVFPRRKGHQMSSKQRAAVSKRMRKYWAARRAAAARK
jgi:hypothetical protein